MVILLTPFDTSLQKVDVSLEVYVPRYDFTLCLRACSAKIAAILQHLVNAQNDKCIFCCYLQHPNNILRFCGQPQINVFIVNIVICSTIGGSIKCKKRCFGL